MFRIIIVFAISFIAIRVFSASEAVMAKTQYAAISTDKKIAYRSFGKGSSIILANRFRGDLESWDPAFLDALAKNHRVVTFQYSGTGSSGGKQATSHKEMAEDIRDLAQFLKINKFAVIGWSLGGLVAQVALTEFPEGITHGILIGTGAPGKDIAPPEKIFFERALKPVNDLDDEVILFFNPQHPESVTAAKASNERRAQRTKDKSSPVTQAQWEQMLKTKGFRDDAYGTLAKMKATKIPLFVVIGEHDPSFPKEPWFEMGRLPTAQLLVLPKTGHGPQQQYPELSAQYISDFIKITK